jgi:hypothetical protein
MASNVGRKIVARNANRRRVSILYKAAPTVQMVPVEDTRPLIDKCISRKMCLMRYRMELGLTRHDILDRMGNQRVSITGYVLVESGKVRNPRLGMIKAIARAYGITLDQVSSLLANR